MVKFSGVFRCYKRPNLTELCLRRIMEMMEPYDFELIMLYDGDDEKYINRMKRFCDFSHIVSNPNKKYTLGEQTNKAVDLCSGRYFMHFENDYYWVHGCMEDAVEAMNYVDVVRLTMFPFSRNNCEKTMGNIGVFKANVGYRFSLNPHLRKERYPVGRFSHTGSWVVEPEYVERFNKSDKVGGCLLKNNFIHLGLYNSNGHFSPGHTSYFLGYNWRKQQDELDPVRTFTSICDNEEYIELFGEYLRSSGGEKWLN